MRIIGDQVTLRDFRKEDIIRRMSWETEQTEWQKWDAPWEYEDLSSEQISKWLQEYQKRLENQAEELLKMDDRVLRRGFEIEYTCGNGQSIGWCSSYFLRKDYTPSPDGTLLAVGIDLPDPDTRGKGLGSQALSMFLDYLFRCGFQQLHTQTWSGNLRMIHVAQRLGFTECDRKVGIRHVRGKDYDALTFCLHRKSVCEAPQK